LVDARDRLLFAHLFEQIYDPYHGKSGELHQSFKQLDDELIELERKAARPQPYRFEITQASPTAEKNQP
jgi:hypothetical protein